MLRRLLSVLGYERRDPESVVQIKRLAEQLNEKAQRFRVVASQAVLLEQRIVFLDSDLGDWLGRAEAIARRPELALDAQRYIGRIEGQLQEARAELAVLLAEEASLTNLLTSGRKVFADGVERARRLGHDVSGCLLFIDLSRPDCPADDPVLADEDRLFVGRVIDSAGIH